MRGGGAVCYFSYIFDNEYICLCYSLKFHSETSASKQTIYDQLLKIFVFCQQKQNIDQIYF